MKISFVAALLILSGSAFAVGSSAADTAAGPNAPYLGQTPPGLTTEVFAPGIVSKEHRELSGFFSPDMEDYFFTTKKTDSDTWWLATLKWQDGQWREHVVMERVERPIMAPDGSYIIGDGERESGQGDGDLYISFQKPGGGWTDAINLGDDINTEASESGAYVSPDGKYQFFSRVVIHPESYDNIDIFWVDAQVIERLGPQE